MFSRSAKLKSKLQGLLIVAATIVLAFPTSSILATPPSSPQGPSVQAESVLAFLDACGKRGASSIQLATEKAELVKIIEAHFAGSSVSGYNTEAELKAFLSAHPRPTPSQIEEFFIGPTNHARHRNEGLRTAAYYLRSQIADLASVPLDFFTVALVIARYDRFLAAKLLKWQIPRLSGESDFLMYAHFYLPTAAYRFAEHSLQGGPDEVFTSGLENRITGYRENAAISSYHSVLGIGPPKAIFFVAGQIWMPAF
jgi:hypothetical protein